MPISTYHNNDTIKTTVNLHTDIKKRIEAFSKQDLIRSQTEFINHSLEQSLDEIEREGKKQELLKTMKSIKKVKPVQNSVEYIRSLRQSSLEKMSK
jgi:paraquat-inducible protein B